MVLFSLHNFARSWLQHGFDLEVNRFFGPKNLDFGPKICFFCYRTPDFVNGPFVALSKDGRFCTFGSIFFIFVSERQPFSWRKKTAGISHYSWMKACCDEGCLTAGFVSFWVVRRSFNLVVFSQESVILIAVHVVQCFLELLSIR